MDRGGNIVSSPALACPAYPNKELTIVMEKCSHFNRFVSVGTLYKREVWRFMKVWNQTVLAPVITTLLFLAVLVLALGGNTHQIRGIAFAEFIAPGLIMMAVVQNAFANTSSSLMLSKIQGVIIDLLMPPFTGAEITFALVMGGVSRGILVAFSVFAAVYIFVPHPTLEHLPFALIYLFLSAMFLALLGCLAGILSNSFDQMAALTNYVITPLSFLSGTFYSIQHLPPIWQTLSHLDPFFYMIDGFRYGLTGVHEGNLTVGLLVLCALNLLLWVGVQTAFTRGWRLKS
jgi:ABC-2 type transport system permease protein